jgi:hypothetical protein
LLQKYVLKFGAAWQFISRTKVGGPSMMRHDVADLLVRSKEDDWNGNSFSEYRVQDDRVNDCGTYAIFS